MIDIIKRAASQAAGAGKPAAFLFGTVSSVSPLVIRVDNRFDISGQAIVLMKEFKAGPYLTHKHTVDPHGHQVPEHHVDTDLTPLETAQEIYFGLAPGDKVVLLQNLGGQQFLVLGRVD